jgi:hypothetical protein
MRPRPSFDGFEGDAAFVLVVLDGFDFDFLVGIAR